MHDDVRVVSEVMKMLFMREKVLILKENKSSD